jgi:hypothetical protein
MRTFWACLKTGLWEKYLDLEGMICSQYSVWLRAGRPGDRGSILGRGMDYSSSLCVLTGSGAQPDSCTKGTGGPFPGGKARPGRDADHSPSFTAAVMNA